VNAIGAALFLNERLIRNTQISDQQKTLRQAGASAPNVANTTSNAEAFNRIGALRAYRVKRQMADCGLHTSQVRGLIGGP